MNNDDFFSQLNNIKNEVLNNTIIGGDGGSNDVYGVVDGNKCNDETIEIKTCLISNEPLVEHNVILSCNHTFNYKPLYNEIYYQKIKRPITEITYLKINQFKCPYCRKIQNYLLLPGLFPELKNVYGVNLPKKYCSMPNKCNYIFNSGKNKGKICDKPCINTYCQSHTKIMKNRELKKDENSGKCENIKNTKKTNMKVKKSGMTNKEKTADTNTITDSIEFITCSGIIKTGKNKGNQCVYKASIQEYNTGNNTSDNTTDNTTDNKYYCKKHKNV